MSSDRRLVVYSTVYPGVERYFEEWYASVRAQTDQDFDLWVSADGLDPASSGLGTAPGIHWLKPPPGLSPTGVRWHAIQHLAGQYWGIIFVDSDDVLKPKRVAAARAALAEHAVAGCALALIDELGQPLDQTMAAPDADWDRWLPRCNVFGLSNTAYRTALLRPWLPLPAASNLADWYLATRAWATGADLHFDPVIGMAYRQHPGNVARVLPPFTPELVRASTERVLAHYACVFDTIPNMVSGRRAALTAAQANAAAFQRRISTEPDRLNAYAQALNQLRYPHLWWACVAHPHLEALWKN